MNARFEPSHIESIAELTVERVAVDLEAIASNSGKLSGIRWERREIAGMTDAEISAYLMGLRSLATSFADWLEGYLSERSAIDEENQEVARILSRVGATCKRIDSEIAGAEGECFQRRHAGKRIFSGRFRKLNETISEIRAFRVRVQDFALSHRGTKESCELARSWIESGSRQSVFKYLLKLEYTPITHEERAAAERTKMEHDALDHLLNNIRKAYIATLDRKSTPYRIEQPAGRVAA